MKRFFFAAVAIFITLTSFSQVLKPVKWSFSTNKLNETEAELIFKAKMDQGWHLYSQHIPEAEIRPVPTFFKINVTKDFKLVGKVLETSKGIEEYDKNFEMNLKYFSGTAIFKQKISLLSDKTFSITGLVEFMTCDDEKCLPPEEIEFSITIEGKGGAEEKSTDTLIVENSTQTADSNKNDTANVNASSEIKPDAPINKEDSLFIFFLLSFLAGLAAILTPCVFPMIPMTVSFFMSEGKSKKKAKTEAFIYGFSIIAIYTIIGTVVAITLGANFANWLSTHWIPNVFFFLIFVIFAASFFGLFEITLPSWLVTKSDKQVDKGGFTGPFFMAFTLVLVSFSCTGPIVGAILVASAGGEILMPIIGMFGFALAFALPFTLFAIFPSWLSNLPKSGGWLNSVKVVLGFLELALGLKFLSIADQTYHWGILDRDIYLAIWIVIFTLMGFYLMGKIKFKHDSEVKHISVPRLTLVLITFSFVVYLIPGIFGAPLKALSGYLPPQSSHDFDLISIIRDNNSGGGTQATNTSTDCEKPKYADFLHLPHGLKGFFDYEQGLACAKKLNKPVFIDFTGHGCVNCREMEANVWSAPPVLKRLRENFVVIALYVDDKTDLHENEWITSKVDGKVKKTLGKKYADYQIERFQVNAQPYYVLLDNNGNLLNQPRAYDKNVDDFVKFLDEGIAAFNAKTGK
ncbi:MAG: disulfide bond formation protein DsbD [Bacteroidetes bacterium GWF2_35_48]|nr:MAG: disulfide bond formation protein DsbD [Bacteroidetes bacterium GWF2_35_48]OFZ02265.1 MAG: disulfide bond formation protein DsbD [Bacteroidetes bacterium RIFOXYC12_FULL_35_7]